MHAPKVVGNSLFLPLYFAVASLLKHARQRRSRALQVDGDLSYETHLALLQRVPLAFSSERKRLSFASVFRRTVVILPGDVATIERRGLAIGDRISNPKSDSHFEDRSRRFTRWMLREIIYFSCGTPKFPNTENAVLSMWPTVPATELRTRTWAIHLCA